MSLRDASNSVPLAIMAERDIRALVYINNIFSSTRPPRLPVEDLPLEAET